MLHRTASSAVHFSASSLARSGELYVTQRHKGITAIRAYKMNWDQVAQKVTPYIVKIETPSGYGTGFLSLYNEDKSWCGISTAAHVVSDADEWQKPIRIRHQGSPEVLLLQPKDRTIFIDWKTDSAVVLFFKGNLNLPEVPITLLPVGTPLGIGVEVGWLGFPNIEQHTLCFFSGNVSARQEFRNAYLIDGVSIHGVSGGPVLFKHETEGVQIRCPRTCSFSR